MLLTIDENECEKNYSKKEFINLIKNDEYIKLLEKWVINVKVEDLKVYTHSKDRSFQLKHLEYLETKKKINLLYNLIHNYLEENDKVCIKVSYNEFKSSYLLSYDKYLFEIGYCNDPQDSYSYYYIREFFTYGSARKKIASNEEYIVKYEDLKKYAIDEKFNKELQQLEEDMRNSVDKDISIEAIETVCNDTTQKIKSKSKTK